MGNPTARAEAIIQRPRRSGIRSVARPIPGVDGNANANWQRLTRERMLTVAAQTAAPADPCNLPGGFTILPSVHAIGRVGSSEVGPVRLRAVAGCDGLPDLEKHERHARLLLEMNIDQQLETALSDRLAALPVGRVVSGPLVSPLAGIGVGIAALRAGAGYYGPVTVLMPEWMQPTELAKNAYDRLGDAYRLGEHAVLFGAGITGNPPTGTPMPPAGQAYLWVTATLEYALHPEIVVTDESHTRRNEGQVSVQQLGYVDFEPTAAYCVRVGVDQ